MKSWSTKLDRQAVLGEGDRACGTTPPLRTESLSQRSCRGFIKFQSRANSIKPQSSEYLLSGGAWKRDKGGQLIRFVVSPQRAAGKFIRPLNLDGFNVSPLSRLAQEFNDTVRLLKRIYLHFSYRD